MDLHGSPFPLGIGIGETQRIFKLPEEHRTVEMNFHSIEAGGGITIKEEDNDMILAYNSSDVVGTFVVNNPSIFFHPDSKHLADEIETWMRMKPLKISYRKIEEKINQLGMARNEFTVSDDSDLRCRLNRCMQFVLFLSTVLIRNKKMDEIEADIEYNIDCTEIWE